MHDPTDPVGRLLFNVLAMVAEFESDLIRLRTRKGMRVAKAKGRLRGRQPKLNARQEAHLVALHHAGEHSTAELGDLFGVGRSNGVPSDRTRHPTPTAGEPNHHSTSKRPPRHCASGKPAATTACCAGFGGPLFGSMAPRTGRASQG